MVKLSRCLKLQIKQITHTQNCIVLHIYTYKKCVLLLISDLYSF